MMEHQNKIQSFMSNHAPSLQNLAARSSPAPANSGEQSFLSRQSFAKLFSHMAMCVTTCAFAGVGVRLPAGRKTTPSEWWPVPPRVPARV